MLWSLRAFNGWPDAFFVLPMCLLGVGLLARAVVARVPRTVGIVAVAAWAVAATAGATHFSVTGRSDVLDEQQASVDAVLAELPDDAEIVSIEAPQPLVLSGRVNPTKHQMFDLGLEDYVDATWPGGLEGFAAEMRQDAPTLLARGTTDPAWLRPVLEDYWEVATVPGLDLVRPRVGGPRRLRPAGRGHRRPLPGCTRERTYGGQAPAVRPGS